MCGTVHQIRLTQHRSKKEICASVSRSPVKPCATDILVDDLSGAVILPCPHQRSLLSSYIALKICLAEEKHLHASFVKSQRDKYPEIAP